MLFAPYAYFCQGGGANQNARFDQVRSITEAGRFSINRYLVYRAEIGPDGGARLVRQPLPARAKMPEHRRSLNSLDVANFEGRFYPNKPPGISLLATPGYALVLSLERALALDPDGWWVLTVNEYLAGVLSVALLSALGGVVFHRLSRRLFPSLPARSHIAAALTFGLGTLMFPFATKLVDHPVVAVLLLIAFGLLHGPSAPELDSRRRRRGRLALAGMLCGLTVLCNYAAVLSVGVLAVYAVAKAELRRDVGCFVAGGVPALLFLGAYHQVCFGDVFSTANRYQTVLWTREDLWLGMFGAPKPDVLVKLLASGHRGLFFSSPVLLLSFYGLWRLWRVQRARVEVLVCIALFLTVLLVASAFTWWHGGITFGPRYLIPALPFLALPLAPAFARMPRVAWPLATYSFAFMLLATAVTPQVPAGTPNPLTDYLLPLAFGSSLPEASGWVDGPVSVNPTGVYELIAFRVFAWPSIQADWNAFNLGEFLWPQSWFSLAPLGCMLVAGVLLVWRWTRREAAEPGTERQS